MSVLGGVMKTVLVLCGAVVGSYGGRVAAAAMRGEEIGPLLRLDRDALMQADVVPGYMAAEIAGKALALGPISAAIVAAAGAAAAAFLDGPLLDGAEITPPAPIAAGATADE